MSIYPKKVQERSESPQRHGRVSGENTRATDASFICGSFVEFSISIDSETKKIVAAGFLTNGCGFMIAAADVLAEFIAGRPLADLHGLNVTDLRSVINEKLGFYDETRSQCSICPIEALRAAFADYREKQIEEFRGEKALICTCFGIAEETIERHVVEGYVQTIDDLTRICNAGAGCGSCRMLIQEIIDSHSAA